MSKLLNAIVSEKAALELSIADGKGDHRAIEEKLEACGRLEQLFRSAQQRPSEVTPAPTIRALSRGSRITAAPASEAPQHDRRRPSPSRDLLPSRHHRKRDAAVITMSLPVPPSVNAMYRNVPGRGRVKTKAYREWIEEAGWMAMGHAPIRGPYTFDMLVSPSLRGDVDNRLKGALDLCRRLRLTDDDKHCVRASVERSPRVIGRRECIVMIQAAGGRE